VFLAQLKKKKKKKKKNPEVVTNFKPTFTIFLGSVDFFCMLVWLMPRINFYKLLNA
jgi:hypothetical protein